MSVKQFFFSRPSVKFETARASATFCCYHLEDIIFLSTGSGLVSAAREVEGSISLSYTSNRRVRDSLPVAATLLNSGTEIRNPPT